MTELNYSKLEAMADKDCEICKGNGVASEGEFDNVHDVPCVCTIGEEADFSGATEGDR